MMRNRLFRTSVVLCLAWLSGTSCATRDDAVTGGNAVVQRDSHASGGDGTHQDGSQLYLVWPDGLEEHAMLGLLRASGVPERFERSINATFVLPHTVALHLVDCEEANVLWHHETDALCLCNALLTQSWSAFEAGMPEAPAEVREALVWSTWLFVAFHTFAQGFLDLFALDLPGHEAQWVDDLTAWLLIEQGAGMAAVDAWRRIDLTAPDASTSVHAHGLDEPRFLDILCTVYGSDPDEFAFLEFLLPDAQLDECLRAYAHKKSTWDRLLAPMRR